MNQSLEELFSDDVEQGPQLAPSKMKFDYQGDDDALDAIEGANEGEDLSKPWMKFHRFSLVTSADEVRALVDRALEVGRVALDLETEGLDNRIEYRENGTCYTRHQIVGYCLGIEGDGYYIPVRHVPELNTDPNPNVDSVVRTEAEIKRLCEAAQPVLKNGSIDVLGAKEKDFEVPPRVVIEFWHAKFDQEFLYPVTGIDIWNPASFDDGMLMVYTLCTEDEQGLKENARQRLEPQVDPKTGEKCPYEMIEYKQLFPRGTPKSERKFQFRVPRDVMPGWNYVLYGCSDAICTNLLCRDLRAKVLEDKRQYGFYTLEKQVVQVVRVIERTRVLINKGEISTLLAEADKELLETEALIRARAVAVGFPADFNPASSAQLADFLFGPQGIWKGKKPEKTTEGQYKTDEKTIEQFAKEPEAPDSFGLIIKHRQISKVRGTYLQNLAENTDELNQLRLNFKQTGAATGRFTAPKGDAAHGYAGVPIQGIPGRDDPKKPKVAHSMRRLFIARPGYVIVKADYASQELRLAASTSGEQKWIAEYEKEAVTGKPADLHYLTAVAFYPGLTPDSPDYKLKRGAGKVANFALIYGGGVGAVQRATGCDKVEGTRLKKAFDDSVPGFSRWVKSQHKRVKEDRGVYTAFKRFISIPDANIDRDTLVKKWRAQGRKFSENEVGQEVKKIRAACERKATNYPVQGCLKFSAEVQTRKGPARIGELATAGEVFEVWTGTRWAHATAQDMGPCELAEVRLKDGTLIECDTRHKLLVVSDAGYDWVRFGDLQPGMAVATSLCEPLELSPPDPLPKIGRRPGSILRPALAPSMERELWYWLGRYVGDGWLDPGGGLVYAFGIDEGDAVERCKAFWTEMGLNPKAALNMHQPATKLSLRYRLEIWSVDLYDWLIQLGLSEGATAHTKRCPPRVFGETLEHRRAFLRGLMDSDGHKPPLPTKQDNVWDPKKRGNPYAVHLCQRPLLVDLKRLFRTVGVESVIRGPYTSGKDMNGDSTTSYRLDLNRRMYERHVMGRAVRLPKPHDMFAPRFLVEELLRAGPFSRSVFGENESAYTLYLRLRTGGKVGVYTLAMLCELLGVELSQPIYGFKRLVEKRALGRQEHTYTLGVQDPLHRYESDGVITKNSGADILKISLVLLLREFHLRGWLKSGGDDSVRMIMTVHDEVVFEIREDRVADALPILVRIMESPTRLLKDWRVPLVAEADIGPSWAAKISWSGLLNGEVKERPPYLVGKTLVRDPEVLVLGKKAGPASSPPPAVSSPASVPPSQAPPAVAPSSPPMRPSEAPRSTQPVSPINGSATPRKVASFRLRSAYVDYNTVVAIVQACAAARLEAAKLKKLHEQIPVEFLIGGERPVLLYSAKEDYRVYAPELEGNLRRMNLLDDCVIREEHA